MSAKLAPLSPRHRGFTLVELLVVIGIIGILIGLVVTIIPKIKRAAYGASTSAQLSAISAAIELYHGDYRAYPGPLANNQLGSGYDPSGTPVYANAQGAQLQGAPITGPAAVTIGVTQLKHITGAQNLVLGLCGGLELNFTNSTFVYNALDIFPDGLHPAPVGAATLGSNPRRQQAYMSPKPGEISFPQMSYNGGNGASFADAAGRSPTDAPIPVFLDKYPDPMPILYIRTNAGAKAIVGIRNYDDNSTQLQDTVFATPVTPQFDLCQVLDYTTSSIGVTTNSAHDHHGLQGVGNFLTDTIDTNGSGSTVNGYAPTGGKGKNGCAYLRDPNFRVDTTVSTGANNYDPTANNTHAGVAREKDGYLLITAGPDRVYGTGDDLIFPGKLLPQ